MAFGKKKVGMGSLKMRQTSTGRISNVFDLSMFVFAKPIITFAGHA
jgi:hypothetical protein